MNSCNLLQEHFPELSSYQIDLFKKHESLFIDWNQKINMISRKDTAFFVERHVLHSLSIAKLLSFKDQTEILDIGAGGGFPGLPLAIMFPNVHFTLLDSIGKKTKVMKIISSELGLSNVTVVNQRAEENDSEYDFIVSRAVAPLEKLLRWSQKNIKKDSKNEIKNGFLCLKGGDLRKEIAHIKKHIRVYNLSDWYDDSFYETKKLLHVY